MPDAGTLIDGKYRILSKLREGGMGAIYKVHHSLLDEIRVIKVMRPHAAADEDLQRRFMREAQLITRVRHRNICLIFDFALDEDMTAYIVMEYINGVNLAEWLKLSGPLEVSLALEIAHQTLKALEYLHRSRIVHRDVSPENMMVTADHDGRLLVKMIDLGIAKALDSVDGVTKTGSFVGKFKYSAPEQLLPEGTSLDGRSDLYSLGVVLYQMLTGELPVKGTAPQALAMAHLFQPPVPFEETDPEERIPPEVRGAVFRALEKKREDRYPDAESFLLEIQRLQERLEAPDLIEAASFVSLVRSTSETALPEDLSPSGSGQARLNQQFRSSKTPLPTETTVDLTSALTGKTVVDEPQLEAQTVIKDDIARRVEKLSPPPAAEKPEKRSVRSLLLWGSAVVVAAVITAAVVLRPEDRNEPQISQGTSAVDVVPLAVPVVSPPIGATSPDLGDTLVVVPSRSNSETETEAATASPTVRPRPSPSTGRTAGLTVAELRSQANRLRESMSSARAEAEAANAEELAASIFSRAEDADRRADALYRIGRFESAGATFNSAQLLFSAAATAAQEETQRRQNQSRAAAAEAEQRRVQEQWERERLAAAQPSPTMRPTAAPSPRQTATEEPRVREAIQRYVDAQESLDVGEYVAVYPSADRARIAAAFATLRSQSLSMDIQRVEISPDGRTATVRGYEKRVAVPRAGTEQRVSGDRIISLANRAGRWVITTIR